MSCGIFEITREWDCRSIGGSEAPVGCSFDRQRLKVEMFLFLKNCDGCAAGGFAFTFSAAAFTRAESFSLLRTSSFPGSAYNAAWYDSSVGIPSADAFTRSILSFVTKRTFGSVRRKKTAQARIRSSATMSLLLRRPS
jgi:hypothetical protein